MMIVRTRLSTHKGVRIMLMIISVLLGLLAVLVGWLLLISPGKMSPLLDENGREVSDGICEKIYVPINGMEQGMFIRGKDKTNPVLLFVHGGPGMPEFMFAEKYPTGMEDLFTVCWWEQRGAGLSFNDGISPESVTVEQMISDTLEVTNYLRRRFGQDKIYLMGHSGGTFFGIQAAARAPECYQAYIGIAQISRQADSERQAYAYMVDRYQAAGNTKMVQKLKQYPILESDDAIDDYTLSMLRDEAMHELGIGTMHNMSSVITGVFLPVMASRAYTLGEKINIWRGKAFINRFTELRRKINATDLTKTVPQLDIPVYFISGIFDYTVSYIGAKDYLAKLQAGTKGFYTFAQSAHCPMFEEPERFLQILREDILTGTTGLSDSK
jgi:pimeloyl-ACP methyl ester carboxylesterase